MPRLVGGCDARPGGGRAGLTTFVIVCMENRSYDHWLGARGLVEGLAGDGLTPAMTNPDLDGAPVAVHRATAPCVVDPPHGWVASHDQWNGGANDGFVRVYEDKHGADVPPHVMSYMTRAELPVTWALADAGTVCDRWFCALLGPTLPNRFYLHSAQSNGFIFNELPTTAGYTWPTIYHRLNELGVPWAYYYSDLPILPLWKDLDPGGAYRRIEAFYDHAAAGTLPPVTVVEPAFTANDDHPPHHPLLGQQFLASIYTALARSPQWENVVLLITYDEHGGFFDHVPPPTVPDERAADGFGQLGFRVPTVAVGPYVRAGAVSSVVHEHSSVARHLGGMHGFAPLTMRDAAASDLADLFDGERLAALDPAPPVVLPAVEIDESMIDEACYRAADPGRKPHDVEGLLAGGRIPAALDRRPELRDVLVAVGEALDRLGGGRIRKGR